VLVCPPRSGNTLYGTLWSDGKWEGPMLPDDDPWLRSVRGERLLFWLDEVEPLGESGRDSPPEWHDPLESHSPSIVHYRRAIRQNFAQGGEKERHLRLSLWWKANDPVRRGRRYGDGQDALRPGDLENITALRLLLSPELPCDALLMAETYRATGDFETCLRMLEPVREDGVEQLRRLALAGIRRVHPIIRDQG
jgi:hypothetical protein